MARFDKLEFDAESNRRATPATEDPKDERYWARSADQDRRAGNYENALRLYSRTLQENKLVIPAWVGQVQMLIQLGEYPQARQWSQKALELFPNNPELLAAQAQAECRLGRQQQAFTLSDAALQLRGESAYRWQVRGEIVIAGRQRTDRVCFDRAQVADSDWLVPLESALIYLHYRSPAKAQQRAQQAAHKQPSSPYSWYVLGVCEAELGMVQQAQDNFRRCLELCPGHYEAGQRLAMLRSGSWSWRRIFRWPWR